MDSRHPHHCTNYLLGLGAHRCLFLPVGEIQGRRDRFKCMVMGVCGSPPPQLGIDLVFDLIDFKLLHFMRVVPEKWKPS